MLEIKKIQINNFKNINKVILPIDDQRRIICILGINGAGKTNILKAVHFLKHELKNKEMLIKENFENWKKKWNIKSFYESYSISDFLINEAPSNFVTIQNDSEKEVIQKSKFIFYKYFDKEIVKDLLYVKNIEKIYEEYSIFGIQIKSYGKEIFLSRYKNFFNYNQLLGNYKDKLFNNEDIKNLFWKISEQEYSLFLRENINKNNITSINNYPEFIISYTDEKLNSKSQIFNIKKTDDIYHINNDEMTNSSFFKDVNIIYENDFSAFALKNEENLNDEKSVLRKIIKNLFKERDILKEIKDTLHYINQIEVLLREIGKKITDYFFSDWKNGKLLLKIRTIDRINLIFGIYIQAVKSENDSDEIGIMYPEDLSSGHIWHIALKILLLNIDTNQKTIILIDEPSNHLHIDLKESFVIFFEEYIKNNENAFLIYTTHSPFMISEKAALLFYNDKKYKWEIFDKNDLVNQSEENIKAFIYKQIIKKQENVLSLQNIIKNSNLKNNEKINKILNFLNTGEGGIAMSNIFNHLNEKIIDILYKKNFLTKEDIEKLKNGEMNPDFLFNKFKKNFVSLTKNNTLPNKENNAFLDLMKSWFLFIKIFRNNEGNAHWNDPKIKFSIQVAVCQLGISLIFLMEEIDKNINNNNMTNISSIIPSIRSQS